jgi:hypothetical protein
LGTVNSAVALLSLLGWSGGSWAVAYPRWAAPRYNPPTVFFSKSGLEPPCLSDNRTGRFEERAHPRFEQEQSPASVRSTLLPQKLSISIQNLFVKDYLSRFLIQLYLYPSLHLLLLVLCTLYFYTFP